MGWPSNCTMTFTDGSQWSMSLVSPSSWRHDWIWSPVFLLSISRVCILQWLPNHSSIVVIKCLLLPSGLLLLISNWIFAIVAISPCFISKGCSRCREKSCILTLNVSCEPFTPLSRMTIKDISGKADKIFQLGSPLACDFFFCTLPLNLLLTL